MKYELDEIQQACFKTGLSKSIVQSIIDNLPHKRTSQQNKSLHVLFQNISFELNRIGMEFTFKGVKGMDIQTTYTPEIVKEFIWRPLQNAMLDKQSTTKLTTTDINAIFEVLARWFADKGIVIDFPSIDNFKE